MTIESIFGTIALITSIIGLLPQAIKAYKTRSTADVSMVMLLNYFACSIAWIIYGICIQSTYVSLSNVVGVVISLALILQKRHYDRLQPV